MSSTRGKSTLQDTGVVLLIFDSFIVLSHDLYEESVDMNVGYYLPAALNYNPPMTVSNLTS